MKIFALAVGDRTRASSRLRVWDHLDWLRAQGHTVRVDHAMPVGAQKITPAVAWWILSRWPGWVWSMLWADRILIQECLLLAPVLWLKRLGKKRRVVFDFSDPVDTIGHGLRNRMQRLGFALTTGSADHVNVENLAYLDELRGRGIPASQFYGPVDVERYQSARRRGLDARTPDERRPVRIGWTGSPSTLAFIEPMFDALDRIAERHDIELVLIGVQKVSYPFRTLKVYPIAWTEAAEFEEVPRFDIGLFALDGSPKSLRRGAGKLFVYMAAGVPFVASNLGIAKDFMQGSGVGFPVDAPSDWLMVLEYAVAERAKRLQFVEQSLAKAPEGLSYQAYRRQLAANLQLAAPRPA